ncbi:MAG: sensor domain-containing diguanylate cyclase [Pseudomonadota bacterium]
MSDTVKTGHAAKASARGMVSRTEAYLQALFEHSPDAIVVMDDDGRCVDANAAACRIFKLDYGQLVERHVDELFKPANGDGLTAGPVGGEGMGSCLLLCGDRSLRYAECRITQHFLPGLHFAMVRDADGQLGLRKIISEIAQGVSGEIGEGFFRSLVWHLCQALELKAAFAAMVDVKSGDMQTLAICCDGEHLENMSYALQGTPCAQAGTAEVCVCPTGARQRYPGDALLHSLGAEGFYGRFLFDVSGKPLGMLAVADGAPLADLEFIETIMQIFSARAASELQRKQADRQLHHYAYHDALTGLPNRMLFNDRLQQALAQAKRGNERIAVMFLDVDRLKMVNDAFGHACGDTLLQAVGDRLRRCVREGDTVARLGGDEFTAVLRNIGKTGNVAVIAEKIIAAFDQPVVVAGNNIYVTASIGISVYPEDGEDAGMLIRCADGAMYRSKSRGGNIYHFSTAGVA